MTVGPTSSYDEVPYSDRCFFMTHPDHLATLAVVHGVPAPPVERCRVLELGCARGGNLLPMALELPESSFVGVDLSVRQIDEARENAARLGLTNVVLHAMSLTEIDASFGLFDYIVCHGVYSWVPEFVRERILSICSENLSPNGLAFVSYNTYPGWHERGVVRELMLYHSRQAASPADRLAMARGFVDGLVDVLPNPASPYGSNLRTEAELLREVSDTYLFHEFLEEENQPLYVHEFLTRAAKFGLEFVAEARTAGLLPGLPVPAQDAISRWAVDTISREQYLDLVCNRAFRQTVLRRSGGPAATGRSPEVIASLSVATAVIPGVPDPTVTDDSTVEFVRPGSASTASTNRPVVKAALLTLYEARPRALDFESLWAGVAGRLADPERPDSAVGVQGRPVLLQALLQLYLTDLVDLHVRPPRPVVDVTERPVSSPYARLQAASATRVTSLRRRSVELEEFGRAVLLQLDGTRDMNGVLDALVEETLSGRFDMRRDGEPVRDPELIRAAFASEIEATVRRLASEALLVG